MRQINIVGISSHIDYGNSYNRSGSLYTGNVYKLTVTAQDPDDLTFKRVGIFHFSSERSLASAHVKASREGNAIIWTVA